MNIFKNLKILKCISIMRQSHVNQSIECMSKICQSKMIFSSELKFKTKLIDYKMFSSVKTPMNAAKHFKPSAIPISRGNQHLLVQLFDQSGQDLGVMNLKDANEKAIAGSLKIVMTDESQKPPHAKLMSGKELYELQVKFRNSEERANSKLPKEKEVEIGLGIEDHDLLTKINMIKNFVEKNHPVTVHIVSRIKNKKEKNIPLLQSSFLKKVEDMLKFAKIKSIKKNEHRITIFLDNNDLKEKEIQ